MEKIIIILEEAGTVIVAITTLILLILHCWRIIKHYYIFKNTYII